MRVGTRAMRLGGLVLAFVSVSTAAFATEKQIRPFIGVTFGPSTTFIDLDRAAGKTNLAVGVSAVLLGEVFGIDVDFADAPGFFESGKQNLVLGSRVTTLSGNLIVAVPRRLAQYSLRPYFVAGGGIMRVRIDDYFRVLPVADVLPSVDIGAGITGFVTNRVGIGWEIRRFQTVGDTSRDQDHPFGKERFSFWRASMALAYRY